MALAINEVAIKATLASDDASVSILLANQAIFLLGVSRFHRAERTVALLSALLPFSEGFGDAVIHHAEFEYAIAAGKLDIAQVALNMWVALPSSPNDLPGEIEIARARLELQLGGLADSHLAAVAVDGTDFRGVIF